MLDSESGGGRHTEISTGPSGLGTEAMLASAVPFIMPSMVSAGTTATVHTCRSIWLRVQPTGSVRHAAVSHSRN